MQFVMLFCVCVFRFMSGGFPSCELYFCTFLSSPHSVGLFVYCRIFVVISASLHEVRVQPLMPS
jgi:hypothetical protein